MTRSYWRPPILRIGSVGALVLLMWISIGYGVFQAMPTTKKLKIAETKNFLKMGDELYVKEDYKNAKLAYENAKNIDPEDPLVRYQLGKCLIKLKQGNEALQELGVAIHLKPQFWEAHLQRSELMISAGDFNSAKEHAQKVLEIKPENKKALLILATALVKLKKIPKARETIETFKDFSENNSQDYYQIGELYSKMSDYPAAKQAFREALKLDPENTEAEIGLAYLQGQQGQWDQAMSSLENILAREPENLKARIGIAESLAAQHEIQQAIDEYRTLLESHPTNPHVATRLASLFIKTSAIHQGVDLLKKVVRIFPNHEKANVLLLQTYYKNERYRLAINCAINVLKIPDSNHEYARKILGQSYINTKQFDLAIDVFHKALEKSPEDFDVNFGLAYALHQKGMIEDAINGYREVARLKPDSPTPYQFLGMLYTEENRINEAIECYHEVLEKVPDDRASANNLAMLLIDRGTEEDVDRAYQLANRLMRQHKNNAAFIDTMGWALYHRGKYEEAQDVFEQAVEIDPYLPDPHYHLGKIFLKRNELEKAQKSLSKALKLSSYFSGAKDARMILSELEEQM